MSAPKHTQAVLYCPWCNDPSLRQPVLSPMIMDYHPGNAKIGRKPVYKYKCQRCCYEEDRDQMAAEKVPEKRS